MISPEPASSVVTTQHKPAERRKDPSVQAWSVRTLFRRVESKGVVSGAWIVAFCPLPSHDEIAVSRCASEPGHPLSRGVVGRRWGWEDPLSCPFWGTMPDDGNRSCIRSRFGWVGGILVARMRFSPLVVLKVPATVHPIVVVSPLKPSNNQRGPSHMTSTPYAAVDIETVYATFLDNFPRNGFNPVLPES